MSPACSEVDLEPSLSELGTQRPAEPHPPGVSVSVGRNNWKLGCNQNRGHRGLHGDVSELVLVPASQLHL